MTSPTLRPSSRSRTRNGKAKDDELEIIWHDEKFTVYSERAHPVSSTAHLVIIFNLHVPSLYMLSASDVPLLVQLRDLAHRLLTDLTSHIRFVSSPTLPRSPSSPASPPLPQPNTAEQTGNDHPETGTEAAAGIQIESQFRVGFVTPPFKDSQIPVKDHLHAHAPIAWYAIEDLIAEIREESSNNRIRSSSSSGAPTSSTAPSSSGRLRPIDRVPNAGARSGTADGHETTETGLAGLMDMDLESGGGRGGRLSSGSAAGSGFGYSIRSRERRNGSGESGSPLPSPPPSSSKLPLHSGYSGIASASSSNTSTPTLSTFAQAQAQARSNLGGLSANAPHTPTPESRPGSSLAPTGLLLSPSYTMPSSSS
ncbi:hypothetical protein A7U60_g7860 [Sanghuangporus baumii]|uniref:Uncharacterized protein n=1 Tax=Sanghuangporus baumii TaxID=108892 RepID=A0A9Q5N5N4_SANBA|nr:hypothetical protein A7U60_g7860 [Sanghuangporus baumii]